MKNRKYNFIVIYIFIYILSVYIIMVRYELNPLSNGLPSTAQ
jgi:hypothetical protein